MLVGLLEGGIQGLGWEIDGWREDQDSRIGYGFWTGNNVLGIDNIT